MCRVHLPFPVYPPCRRSEYRWHLRLYATISKADRAIRTINAVSVTEHLQFSGSVVSITWNVVSILAVTISTKRRKFLLLSKLNSWLKQVSFGRIFLFLLYCLRKVKSFWKFISISPKNISTIFVKDSSMLSVTVSQWTRTNTKRRINKVSKLISKVADKDHLFSVTTATAFVAELFTSASRRCSSLPSHRLIVLSFSYSIFVLSLLVSPRGCFLFSRPFAPFCLWHRERHSFPRETVRESLFLSRTYNRVKIVRWIYDAGTVPVSHTDYTMFI